MTIAVGEPMPAGTLVKVGAEGPQPVEAESFFKGRTVALFAVPGAFTPTCSAKHLPGFVEKADELKAKGVDEIACLSVNDAFVMKAWGDSAQCHGKVTMLADGNGDYARTLGLDLDASGFGMGTRVKRFSALIRDGIVEKLNLEEGGSFGVSSAEHMLEQL